MKIFSYLFKEYLLRLYILFIIVTILVFLLDFIEIFKRYYDQTLFNCLVISLSKTNQTLVKISPILVLIATIINIQVLSKRGELMGLEILGFSQLKFKFFGLFPLLIFFLINLFILEKITPNLQNMTNKIINHHKENFHITDKGFLFKQENLDINYFIFANKIQDNTLIELEIWIITKNYQVTKTIIAKKGLIAKNGIILQDITIYNGIKNLKLESFTIPALIDKRFFFSNFQQVETIPISLLPNFIKSASNHGFSTILQEKYFYNNISLLISFITMFLLGFQGGYQRNIREKSSISSTIIIGLVIFFLENIIVVNFIKLKISVAGSIILAKILILLIILIKNDLSFRYRN
jgi:lipopolysaccharide export LptBFGC system permease protein LptF